MHIIHSDTFLILLRYVTFNCNGSIEKLLQHQIYTGKKCKKM